MKNCFTKITALVALLLTFAVFSLHANPSIDANNPKKDIKKNLPYLMNSNNAGTLFYLTFHPTLEEGVQAGSGLRLYISSAVATTVTLEVRGLGIFRQRTTIPNDVIEFFLAPTEGQMYYKVYETAKPEQVWEQRAIRISSDDPIIVYGVARFYATSDGYLALPASSLGTNYQVASSPNAFSGWGYELPSFTSVIGIYDDTKVTFRMGGCENCNALKNDGSLLPMNGTIRRTINEGDVWLIPGVGPFSDLTGSTIKANKPINVISGNQCAQIPTHARACDHTVEQETPEHMWGTKLHVTPIFTRKNYSVIKIFAKKPFTQVYQDGTPAWYIASPGGINSVGFIETRAGVMGPGEIEPGPIEISSDEAINVVQYNPAAQDDNGTDNDPFQMSLTPIEQYQKEIVFNSPGIRGQYGFKANFINIVYLATSDGSIPEDMMWAEVNDGQVKWIPMRTYSGNPGKRFRTTEPDGRHYRAKTVKLPYDGVFRIKANDGLAAYAYGYDYFDSYGWPTSVAVADLETPDSLAPFVEYAKDCSGDVTGFVIDEPRVDPQNRSNLGLVYMATDNSYNYNFKYAPFTAGIDFRTDWTLEVRNAALNAQAQLIFVDRAGNMTDTIIQHFAISPTMSPYYSNYGMFKVEQPNLKKRATFTLRNDGDNPITAQYEVYVILDSDEIEDKAGDITTYQNFDIIDVKGVNLSPMAVGQEKTFEVEFTATAEGSYRDSVGLMVIDRFTREVCVHQYFALVTANVGNPYITTVDKNFFEQVVNNRTVNYDLTVTNPVDGDYKATTSLLITGIEFAGDEIGHSGSGSVFEVTGLNNVTADNPIVLAPGASRTFSVSFMPKEVRDYASSIKFIADAQLPKNTAFINGRGIQPGLLVNGENWGERLVDPNAYIQKGGTFTYTPYDSENGAIELSNDGSAIVTLRVPEIVGDHVNGSAFKAMINGNLVSLTTPGALADLFDKKQIAPNTSLKVPVVFDPKVNGNHELVIRFNSDAVSAPTSTLSGIGVFPRSETDPVNFGNVIVGTGSVTKTVDFRAIEWNNDYPVTITDFVANAENAATTFTDMSGNGILRWDRNNIKDKDGNNVTLPVTLQPGDFLTITGEFEPTTEGSFEGTLTTVSDAEVEAVSVWTATSEVQGSIMTPATAQTCVNAPVTLRPTITNTGSLPLQITGIRLESTNPDFNFGDFVIANETFTLEPTGQAGDREEIVITFTPGRVINNMVVDVIVETNSSTKPEDRTTITVSSSHVVQPTYSLVSAGGNQGTQKSIEIDPGKGDAVIYTLTANTATAVPLAESLIFEAQVTYSKNFLGLAYTDRNSKAAKVAIGDRLAQLGWSVTAEVTAFDEDTNEETITLTFRGPAPLKDSYGDLVLANIMFDSYLPWYKDSDGNVKIKSEPTIIEHEVLNNDPCVSYTAEYSTVTLNPTCVDNLRPIQISASKYGLKPIAPNPVGANGADVNFSVGGTNIFTEVKLYNSSSELVEVIYSGTLNPGEYSARIPVEKLSSGMYFIEMVSGPFTSEYEKLIINK